MKSENLIIFFIFGLFALSSITAYQNQNKKFLKADPKPEAKPEANSAQPQNKPDEKSASKPLFSSNVVGILGKNIVVQAPENITSCEQYFEFDGESVDINDFTKKEKRKYSMSAYFIHELSEKGMLIKSIQTNNIIEIPGPLEGAPKCIRFISKFSDIITVCPASKEATKSILDNFSLFSECRTGGDLLPAKNDTHVFNTTVSCLGLKIIKPENMDEVEYKKAYNTALTETVEALDKKYQEENLKNRFHLKNEGKTPTI